MLSATDAMVRHLHAAYEQRIPAPALHDVTDAEAETAYDIARRVFEARFGSSPQAVRGYKVSLTNASDQRALQTDTPLYGRLAAANLVASPARISVADLFCPIIEPEVVFRIDADLSPAASTEEIVANTHVGAAFDLPDSRYANWPDLSRPTAVDLVADNACIGLIVHGEALVPTSNVDLPDVRCTMTVDGRKFGVGLCSAVSGSPLFMVQWLSRKLAEHGTVLRAGDLVSSGAVIAPHPLERLRAGRTYRAEFAGIGTASLDAG